MLQDKDRIFTNLYGWESPFLEAAKKRGDVGAGAAASVSLAGDALTILIGLAAYAAIAFYLHPILFGVVATG